MNTKTLIILTYILFFFFSSFYSCNVKTEKLENTDVNTLIITDTIRLFEVSDKSGYLENRSMYLENYKHAYNSIKETPFSNRFFQEIRGKGVYVNYFTTGMIYEEPIIYNAVVLFYLKYYMAFLESHPYAFKLMGYIGENSFMPVFFLIFIKLSEKSPEEGVLPIDAYNWVLEHPIYLENEDIAKQVEEIKIKLKE